MCTDAGVMFAWPFSRVHIHLLPEPLAWTTGSRPETGIVDPLLAVTAAVLAVLAIDPAAGPAAWSYALHYV
jgi:hypothetical protein